MTFVPRNVSNILRITKSKLPACTVDPTPGLEFAKGCLRRLERSSGAVGYCSSQSTVRQCEWPRGKDGCGSPKHMYVYIYIVGPGAARKKIQQLKRLPQFLLCRASAVLSLCFSKLQYKLF